jgi:hypothetical protein
LDLRVNRSVTAVVGIDEIDEMERWRKGEKDLGCQCRD